MQYISFLIIFFKKLHFQHNFPAKNTHFMNVNGRTIYAMKINACIYPRNNVRNTHSVCRMDHSVILLAALAKLSELKSALLWSTRTFAL